MRKMIIIAVMVIVAMTASAQNTLRDKGTFTLQPKVGIGLGSLSGEYTTIAGVDNKIRVGLVAGIEGEYYAMVTIDKLNIASEGGKVFNVPTDYTPCICY